MKILLLFMLFNFSTALASEITLRQALDQAQNYSPDLKASQSREVEAVSSAGIAQSYYYPSIEAQAIDSTGFPGSTGYLGIGGLMGSPFRSGLGAGVVMTETLFDFGRTVNRVESREHQIESRKQDTEVTRARLNQEVIQAFFGCSLNRTQKETWLELRSDAEVIQREVNHFVQTGQRSIVDRYLAETQIQQARTASADYETRQTESQKRLAILMGAGPKADWVCPVLKPDQALGLSAQTPVNPIIARAAADLQSIQSQLSAEKAENLPTIVGLGSVGYLQDTRLVNRTDYSLGIGISIPLFEGFRIKDTIDRSAAEVQEKDFNLQASRQLLDDLNQQYNETILSTANRLQHLTDELKLAQEAFNLAKKRYFAFQGELLDVRETLSNLIRVSVDENTTLASYLQSKESKEVLNGAK